MSTLTNSGDLISTYSGQNITNTLQSIDDIIIKRILEASLPIEVHETESLKVTIDGQVIDGIWVNKEDSIYWRSGNVNDTRNALVLNNSDLELLTANCEIIKKNYTLKGDMFQNVNFKFLKPPPPCIGDLIIEQMPDIQLKPLPPIWIQEKQPQAANLPPEIYREKPRLLDCVPEQTIKLDGKSILPPRQLIVERLPKLGTKQADIYVERWLGLQKLKRQVKYKETNAPSNLAAFAKNKIVDWTLQDERNLQKKFNYLGVEAPVDPEGYIRQYSTTLVDSNNMPEYANHYNADLQAKGEILAINQPMTSDFDLVHANDETRQALEKASSNITTIGGNLRDFVEYRTQFKTPKSGDELEIEKIERF